MNHQTCSVADSDERKKPHRERRRVVWIDCQKSQIEVCSTRCHDTTRRHDLLACPGRLEQPNQNPNTKSHIPKSRHKLLRLPQDTSPTNSPPPASPTSAPLQPNPQKTAPQSSKKIYTSFPHNHSITTSTVQQNIELLASTYQLNRAYVPSHKP